MEVDHSIGQQEYLLPNFLFIFAYLLFDFLFSEFVQNGVVLN